MAKRGGRGLMAGLWGACLAGSFFGADRLWANDGFGGLSATGLTFSQTDAIRMEEEDLFIGLERIEVSYLFRNTTGADVSGEVIFPLPPIALADLLVVDWNLPEDLSVKDLLRFTAKVDGKAVPVGIDPVAVLVPARDRAPTTSEIYDTPGRDVTALLEKHGIPISLDTKAVYKRLSQLPQSALRELADARVIEVFGEPRAYTEDEIYLRWSIVLRYHWTQTFPAGQALRIQHGYDNRPWGGIFVWSDPPLDDWQKDLAKQYCIDSGTSKGIMKALAARKSEGVVAGTSYNIEYVLRTANSWAGPIGTFRLTLDKGAPENIISLCAEGVQKIGPTRFRIEKKNYRPEKDLEILVVTP